MDGNYTKFPNNLLDATDLDVYEFRIISIIARKTIGYNKKSDGISLSQFMKFGKMGKPKVIQTLKKLKDKNLIISIKQKTKTGAHSYTRYRLKVVSESYPMVSESYTHKDNNTKENRHNIEREYIHTGNIFSSLKEKDQEKETERYIQHAINEHGSIKSEKAFSVTLRKKFNKQDKSTLEEFEKWFLIDKSDELQDRYHDEVVIYNEKKFEVEEIYPYFRTVDYVTDSKLYISLTRDNDKKIIGFNDIYELEHQLGECQLHEE